MNGFTPKQSYKNRAEAYRKFVQEQNLPVSQTKFYNDCERYNMVKVDKSIDLSALLAYVREELKIDASTGRSLTERDQSKKMDELDLKEKELKIAKLEREGRKEDRDWIHREKANEREGALVGQILMEGKYQLPRIVAELILLCKGDPQYKQEVSCRLLEAYYNVFRTLYDSAEIDIAFEDED